MHHLLAGDVVGQGVGLDVAAAEVDGIVGAEDHSLARGREVAVQVLGGHVGVDGVFCPVGN